MNIDTDTQWATTKGVKEYMDKYQDYLKTQVGNPEGGDKPNKKYYDPRKWIRKGQLSLTQRAKDAFKDLNALNRN